MRFAVWKLANQCLTLEATAVYGRGPFQLTSRSTARRTERNADLLPGAGNSSKEMCSADRFVSVLRARAGLDRFVMKVTYGGNYRLCYEWFVAM